LHYSRLKGSCFKHCLLCTLRYPYNSELLSP